MKQEHIHQIMSHFGGLDKKTTNLYNRALVRTDLDLVDYYTIHDLVKREKNADHSFHGLLLCLFLARNEGSLCIKLDQAEMTRLLVSLTDSNQESAELAGHILAAVQSSRYQDTICTDAQTYFPLILQGHFLYFQKYLHHKQELENIFRGFLEQPGFQPLCAQEKIPSVLEAVLHTNPIMLRGAPIRFNPEQQLAIILTILKNFVIISGGPGTGKTSLIVNILRCLVRCHIPMGLIQLTAPTGRAARHLTDSIRQGLATIGTSSETERYDRPLEQISAGTIHRVLKYSPNRNSFIYNRYNLLPGSVLIIDEVSMVDIVLMTQLLESLDQQTRVIMLGDKDQLPSVEAGAILADLMPQTEPVFSPNLLDWTKSFLSIDGLIRDTDNTLMQDRVVVLRDSYRSETSIRLISAQLQTVGSTHFGAENILNQFRLLEPVGPVEAVSGQGSEPELVFPELVQSGHEWSCLGGGCWRIPLEKYDQKLVGISLESWFRTFYTRVYPPVGHSYSALLARLADMPLRTLVEYGLTDEEHNLLRALFGILNGVRILTFARTSPLGCIRINEFLCEQAREQFGHNKTHQSYFHGMPLIITRNDYDLQLFNGDIGVILQTEYDKSWRAFFEHAGCFVSYALPTLPSYEPAFAMTVHKSQGSEFDHILIVLPDDPQHRLLYHQIIYTALTRAKYLAVILARHDVLLKALNQKMIRESGLDLWGTDKPEI
ncbi:AAA family ATPase [bacterium]|nr:AAA family ATPase [bacterium]